MFSVTRGLRSRLREWLLGLVSRLGHRLAAVRRETAVARSLDFVEIQNNEATAAVASIEDAAECGERADALVSGLLARVMRQRAPSRRHWTTSGRCRGRRGRTAGSWREGRARGAAPDAGPAEQEQVAWEAVRGLLPGLAQEVLRDDPDDGIGPGLAFDETADLRKGKSAACVSPQHAGVTGKVENCVTWVFAALVTAFGQAWVDFDVYMPDCWAKDPQRREKAGIPEGWRSPPSQNWPSSR